MSGFGGGAAPIQQIVAGAGITILNGFGPITTVTNSAPVGVCATYIAAGAVEVATNAETLGGTQLGGSGCYLAVNPANMTFREEAATGAMFAPFTATTPIVAGFGANAVDIQGERGAAAQIASGNNSLALGDSNTASGTDSQAVGNDNLASGTRGACFGGTNAAVFDNCVAVGYDNLAGDAAANYGQCVAMGRSNFAYDQSSVAIGILNNCQNAAANIADATGVIINDPQVISVNGANSVSVGIANTVISANALRSCLFGFKNQTTRPDNVLLGIKNTGSGVAPATTSVAVGFTNGAAGSYGVALGSLNAASGANSNMVGYDNAGTGANGSCFGRSNNVGTGVSAVALGVMNNVNAPANLNDTTGAIINDPQLGVNAGINSLCVGAGNLASGLRSNAIGFKSNASATGATAIGDRAINRIQETTNISGAIIIRKDDGEVIADALRVFAGAEDIILTDEIDLTAIADHTITLPAGCSFWFTEAGIILTELTGAITTQPTVHFGITGTPAKYLAATLTTLLTATLKRERFQTLLEDDGEGSLLFGVTVAAVVATSMSGRAFFRGVLIENE